MTYLLSATPRTFCSSNVKIVSLFLTKEKKQGRVVFFAFGYYLNKSVYVLAMKIVQRQIPSSSS